MLVSVDIRDVRLAAGVGVDNGAFGDEQSTRGTGPLSIILKGKVTMNVALVRPKPRHRTENDPILEVHATDTNRLEEFRHGHFESSRYKDVVDVRSLGELGWGVSMGLLLTFLYAERRKAVSIYYTLHNVDYREAPGPAVDQRRARDQLPPAKLSPEREKKSRTGVSDGEAANQILAIG